MLEATSWHDKVLPAAKAETDLQTCVLAAGLSSCWDLPPKFQHCKERGRDISGSRQCPSRWLGTQPNRYGSRRGREGGDGDLGTVENCHTGLQDPGVGPGASLVVSQACCWNYCLETTCSYLLCHISTSTPNFENLFRMANNFYPEKKSNQSGLNFVPEEACEEPEPTPALQSELRSLFNKV